MTEQQLGLSNSQTTNSVKPVRFIKCASCGDPFIFTQDHHMAYGSQPLNTEIPLCNKCHEIITNSHHLETYINRQKEFSEPYHYNNKYYKANYRAMAHFNPNRKFKRKL